MSFSRRVREWAPRPLTLSFATGLLAAMVSLLLSDPSGDDGHAWLVTPVITALLLRGQGQFANRLAALGFTAGAVTGSTSWGHPLWLGVPHSALEVATAFAIGRVLHEWPRVRAHVKVRLPVEAWNLFGYLVLISLASLPGAVLASWLQDIPGFGATWRRWLVWEVFGLLAVFPVAMLASRKQWALVCSQRYLPRSLMLGLVALLVANWTVSQPDSYDSYVITTLILGAFFVPALTTAAATASCLLLFLASDVPGGQQWLNASSRDPDVWRIAMIAVTPSCVAFILRERERGKALLDRVGDQLRALYQMQEAILAGSGPTIAYTLDGSILSFNASAERLLGYSADEVVERANIALIHDEQEVSSHAHRLSTQLGMKLEAGARAIGYLAARGARDVERWTYVRKDKTLVPVMVTATALRDASGATIGVVSSAADLSEALRVDGRFRQAVEAAPIAFMIANQRGQITMANPESERLFGYEAGMLIGRSIDILLPAHVRMPHAALRASFHGNPSPRKMGVGRELMAVRSNGEEFAVEVGLSPIETSDGASVLAMVLDITARKRAEVELERQRHSLRIAKDAAESANRAKTQLFAAISHEIRTPMNVVLGMNRLAQMQQCPPAVANYLGKIEVAAKHLLGVLNDVLDFSKIDAGRMTIEHAPFAIGSVVEMATTLVNSLTSDRQLRFKVTVSGDFPPYVVGDRVRVQQIVTNLLNNAVKFTPQGELELAFSASELSEDRIVARIDVRDTGIGMTKEQLARVFEPFWQADSSSTREHSGTGLGLDICKRLIELMGGRIDVQSQPGVGTKFSVTLPLRPATSKPLGSRENAADRARATGLLRGLRVLIAEDHALNYEVLSEFLRGLGVQTTRAVNGRDAVAQADTGAFDLVMMDLQMPVLDGFDATLAIRRTRAQRELPIIAMTADVFAEDKHRCFVVGMNDHIAKPFDPDALVAALAFWSGRVRELETPASAPPEQSPLRPLLTPDDAMARINHNRALYMELLAAFFTDHAGTEQRLSELTASQRVDEVRALAHRVRSEAHNLGLPRLAAVAATVDQGLRSGPLADMQANIEALADVFASTLKAIGGFLAEPKLASDSPALHSRSEPVPTQRMLDALRSISQELAANRLDALRTLSELERAAEGTPSLAPLHEVGVLARQLKFREAATRLDELASSMGEAVRRSA